MSLHKNFQNLLAVPFLLVFFAVFTAKTVNAAEFHFNGYTLAQDQTVNDNVYASGDTVDIKGVINGDLFVAGQTVNISGTISGDIYAAGASVSFTGNAYSNVVIAANTISLSGNIKGNASTIGNVVDSSAHVEKDLTVISNNINLTGSVSDDVRVIGNSASISSVISGELVSLVRSSNVEKDKVSGNIYDNDTIKGIAQSQGVNFETSKEVSVPKQWSRSLDILGGLVSFIGLGLAGYFLISISPVKTGKIINKITGSTGDFFKSFGLGLLIVLLVPIPLVLLFVSLFGFYIGLLVLGLLIFLMIFGRIWVEVSFGQEVLGLFKVKAYRPFKSLLIGRFISVMLRLVPVLGGLYSFVLVMTSIGAFTRMKLDYMYSSKGKKK